MTDFLDQIFVLLKHWVVNFFPETWQPVVSALLSIIPIVMVFPLLFAITTVLERKGLGRIQNRLGPAMAQSGMTATPKVTWATLIGEHHPGE